MGPPEDPPGHPGTSTETPNGPPRTRTGCPRIPKGSPKEHRGLPRPQRDPQGAQRSVIHFRKTTKANHIYKQSKTNENCMASQVLAVGDGGSARDVKRLEHMHICMPKYTYMYTYMHVHIREYICICICACKCICTCIRISAYRHTHNFKRCNPSQGLICVCQVSSHRSTGGGRVHKR